MTSGGKRGEETGGGRTATCGEVVERLVAGTDRGGTPADPSVAEHARSCMSCFRAMTELRDVPRIAEALRAAAAPVPDAGERFWEALAERTTDAVMGAGREPAPPRRARRLMNLRGRVISMGALVVAAAASWMLVLRHPAPPVAAPTTATALAEAAHPGADDGNETLADVADLDTNALRQLLDRLGRHAPAPLARGSADDGADVPADDEVRVSDEIAELDGDALRRVASSLEASAL
jgi:hypothetical protein